MKEGIINLLKPAGMTSHDAVSMLRRLTGIKRIGHTGTLDPMAAGVLPLCVGSVARINEYLDLDRKTYRCEMLLGLETDTLDIWGEVTADRRDQINGICAEQVAAALAEMNGIVYQRPPSYSAVRIDGKRLYEYAREGKMIEGKKRPVILSDMQFLNFDKACGRVTFQVTCSKGTYVRTICRDVGELLGCKAAMSCLLRMNTGAFTLTDSVTIEQLQEAEDWTEFLLSADFPLEHFGAFRLRPERVKWFLNGGYLLLRDGEILKKPLENAGEELRLYEEISALPKEYSSSYRIYDDADVFLGTAVYQQQEQRFTADKVFYR